MWCQSSKPVKHPIFPVCIFYFAPLKSGTKKPKVNPICGNEILGKTNLLTVVMVVRRCSLDVIFKRSFPCLSAKAYYFSLFFALASSIRCIIAELIGK